MSGSTADSSDFELCRQKAVTALENALTSGRLENAYTFWTLSQDMMAESTSIDPDDLENAALSGMLAKGLSSALRTGAENGTENDGRERSSVEEQTQTSEDARYDDLEKIRLKAQVSLSEFL